MKRKLIGLLGAGALVLVLGLFSGSAQAELKFGGLVGWYSPNFGEINDYLDWENDFWGTDLQFEGGMAYGAALEYGITPNFRLRGEWNGFKSETSETIEIDPGELNWEYKLNVNTYLLSVVYMGSPGQSVSPYMGVGVGQFMTKFQWEYPLVYLMPVVTPGQGEETAILPQSNGPSTYSGSETQGPIGFQVFVGIEAGTRAFSFRGEARYISAEAEMNEFPEGDISIDLSGLFLNVAAVIGF
jgi:hypothetical protein